MQRYRTILSYTLFIAAIAFSGVAYAQNEEGGGDLAMYRNDAAHPCITPAQYAAIEKRIAENLKMLGSQGHAPHRTTTATTTFSWPLQAAGGLADCGYYGIFNYVDQDATSPGIKDYNCGAVTYDGHRGTDICTLPYPFYKMDNNLVDVVAAAPGTIIEKSDGFFDKNCAMSSDTANYIIIQHADGSCALYWHMKKFSLTSKTVGMSVATGEFLGVVGSSGSSTAPHLHFEVWNTTASSSLQDPYTGTCNLLNPATWWVSQKPYTEPAVIKAQVNMIPVVLPGCDTTETSNEDSCFTGGVTAKFYIFIRNETVGDTAHESIINPDGSTFSTWNHVSSAAYLASYWYFNRPLPSTPGIYTFRVTYNGLTCDKTFKIDCGTLAAENIPGPDHELQIYPNPASNELFVSWGNKISNVSIRDLLGHVVYKQYYDSRAATINVANLPKGIYLLQATDAAGLKVVKKFVKE